MIYLIYGHQLPVIKKTLKKLIKTCLNGNEQDDFNVEKFSSRLTLVQDIVFSCLSMPLGSDRKVVVVTEPYYLSTDKEKSSLEKDQDYKCLVNYINNPSEFTDLIFFLESKDVSAKNEVYKAIKAKGKIIEQEVLTEDMLKQMGTQLFVSKGSTISNDALNELVSRCGDDVSKFTIEATKLSLYKENISLDDVKLLVAPKLEDNAFLICEALLRGKINNALKIYYDLRVNKFEPIVLISLIASQFRFLSQVSFLSSKGLSADLIASELKSKPFRIKKNLESLIYLKHSEINNILDALHNLDVDIKSGKKDPYYGFELFLINFNQVKNR